MSHRPSFNQIGLEKMTELHATFQKLEDQITNFRKEQHELKILTNPTVEDKTKLATIEANIENWRNREVETLAQISRQFLSSREETQTFHHSSIALSPPQERHPTRQRVTHTPESNVTNSDIYGDGQEQVKVRSNSRKRGIDNVAESHDIGILKDAYRKLQRRIDKMEGEQERRSFYRDAVSSRASHRFRHSRPPSRNPQREVTPPTPPPPPPILYVPANVDGNIPELTPSTSLDGRHILWPHVSTDMIKNIFVERKV